ncbi:MAG: DUF1566 domain-containing protein [Sphaerochaeta sp.]|nr:DUF1566 domain-containing protein [Sphaerochaeta sp.]
MKVHCNSHTVHLTLLSLILLLLMLGSCATTQGEESVKIYSIGEKGPAGGLVFYDKGSHGDGWRYLEVAPGATERPLNWGMPGVLAGSASPSVGDGGANTAQIILTQKDLTDRDYAAKYCDELVVNGYSDWYLPSKEELDLLYWPLSVQTVDEFKGLGHGYWSSTEYDETLAWGQGFHKGVQGRIEKTEQFLVRAIRSF